MTTRDFGMGDRGDFARPSARRFQEGRLDDAIAVQKRLVNEQRNNVDGRLFLAELLLFQGDIDAVRSQLAEIPVTLPGMPEYLLSYRRLLDAESKRQRLLYDANPEFLGDPPEHLLLRLEALEHLRHDRPEAAFDLLDEADAHAPWVAGHIDGREFDGVRNGDDLLASLLELLVDDRYIWFPFDEVSRLRLGPVSALRDHLFIPAELRAINGQEWAVFLPTTYAGSHGHADSDIRLGRATDWRAAPNGPTRGAGLQLLNFGEEELTLLDFTQWEK